MRHIMLVGFITAALLGGQNRAVARSELTFLAAVKPVVQLKTGSLSGVITDPIAHAVAGATVTALRRDASAASTLRSFSVVSDGKGVSDLQLLP
jgi:hypothetical protein